MDTVFYFLSEFVRFLFDEWVWFVVGGGLLFLVWYRQATSPLPSRRASFVRR